MPLSLYEKLKLGAYSPTSITLQMADKTRKQPVGMIEDVLVRIDEHVMPIPTEFIILDIPEDDKLSIILGRPFLSTAGAYVDCVKGKITFNVYDKEIVRHFPGKGEQRNKYITPARRTNTVNALLEEQPEVRTKDYIHIIGHPHHFILIIIKIEFLD